MSNVFIDVRNITKYYKIKKDKGSIRNLILPVYQDFLAVKNVSFEVMRNEIFGILGPNGAGKTTIVKILCGLLEPTSGSIIIDNKDVSKNFFKIQSMTGTMFGNTMIYYRLTGYDNLKYYCKIYNILNYNERINELLDLVDLTNWKNQYVENYSLGMKSKLALARALIHDPEILILDEPTLGLDPENSRFIRILLKEMEKTIIITTHNMEVANDVCSRIALLKQGNIIAIDTPEKLRHSVLSSFIYQIETKDIAKLTNELNNLEFIEHIKQIAENRIEVQFHFEENLPTLMDVISKYKISEFKSITPSLEDAFLKFTIEK